MFAMLLVAILCSCAFAATWDIRDGQWSSINDDASNPFKFGFVTVGTPPTFTLYTYSEALAAAWGDSGALAYFDPAVGTDGHGNIMLGTNENTVVAWNGCMDPHMILSGPSPQGTRNTIAFTAPEAGNYKLNCVLSGRAILADYGWSTVDTYLYVNGEQIGVTRELRGQAQSADGSYGPNGENPIVTYDNVLVLQAGDVVWISWDGSPDGITCDVIGVECSVETVSGVATVTGTVTDGDGNPIKGVTVTTDAGGYTVTDALGIYTIELSDSGSATVFASKSGYIPAEREVSYATGDTTTCDFTLETRQAKTYYIDSENGDDAADGLTAATAWQTFMNVTTENVEAGDTVILTGEFSTVSLNGFRASEDNPITFKASDAGVTFTSEPGFVSFYLTNSTGIVMDGFNVTGGTMGMRFTGCEYLEIANCKFIECHPTGAGEGYAVRHESSPNCYYHNNLFYHNCGDPVPGTKGGVVFTTGTHDVRFYNNTMLYSSHCVSAWNSVSNIYLKNNIFGDCYGPWGYVYCYAGAGADNAFIADHNLFYAFTGYEGPWYFNCTGSTNDMVFDPQFLSYARDAADNNFNLGPLSEAIDAGVDVGLPYKGDAPDLGAYETDYSEVVFSYIEGTVYKAANGITPTAPLAGAIVSAAGASATTDADGYYKIAVSAAGNYDVTATYGAYATVTESGVNVPADTTVTLNLTLNQYVGDTYYVATDGDDWGGDGTEDNPFYTIDRADEWEMLKPGDTIIVKEGTYCDEDDPLGYKFMHASGDFMAPITIKGEGNVVIDASSHVDSQIPFLWCGMFIGDVATMTVPHGYTVQNIEFTGSEFGLYFIDGSNFNTVADCRFHDLQMPTTPAPILPGNKVGMVFSVGHDNLAVHNLFYDIERGEATSVGGIAIPQNSNTKIINNTFDNTNAAIFHWNAGGSNNLFANNIVMNMENTTGAMAFNFSMITAKNNLFYGNVGAPWGIGVTDGGGNIDADPMLDENYVPQAGSFAIDGGLDFGYAYEGNAPDMGAFESTAAAADLQSVYWITSGRVIDTNGDPVSGATVNVSGRTYTSVSNGNFIYLKTASDERVVTVNATRANYAAYTGTFDLGESGEITIVMEFDKGEISGVVINALSGNPIAGATVSSSDGATATTDGTGAYVLNTDGGTFTVTVEADNFKGTSDTVTVARGDKVTKDFALVPTVQIWNAYDDFSLTANPNGVWSYGWQTSRTAPTNDNPNPAPNPMTLYPACADAGAGDYNWWNGSNMDTHGYLGARTAAGVRDIYGHYREPYMIYMGSTFGPGDSMIRFTAPADGDYTFDITMSYNGDALGANGVIAYIDHNNENLAAKPLTAMYQVNPEDENSYLAVHFTVFMTAGETMDACVYSYGYPLSSCTMLREFTVTAPVTAQSVDSVSDLNDLADGTAVTNDFDLVAITAGNGEVYASQTDRLAGVKLDLSTVNLAVAEGDRLVVEGVVASDENGKYIMVTEVKSKAAGDKLGALAMTKNAVDTNVLVRAWGKVVSVSDGTFVINNGSGDTTVIGTTTAAVGDFVTVTGVATKTGVLAKEIL